MEEVTSLKYAIKEAVKNAANELFKKNETFYYLVLVTTEEAHSPVLSAWSYEALERHGNDMAKWSYADSPYCNFGEKYFEKVNQLFGFRPWMSEKMTDEEWEREFNFRIDAMEFAMKELDEENIFDRKNKRKEMVINVEVMPPNHENTRRASRLNNIEILKEILEENYEEEN